MGTSAAGKGALSSRGLWALEALSVPCSGGGLRKSRSPVVSGIHVCSAVPPPEPSLVVPSPSLLTPMRCPPVAWRDSGAPGFLDYPGLGIFLEEFLVEGSNTGSDLGFQG